MKGIRQAFSAGIFVLMLAPLLHFESPANAQVFDQDYYAGAADASTARVDVGVFSDRLFRGQNLYNGTSVQTQLRAGVDIGFGEIYGKIFSHFSADQDHSGVSEDRRSFSEFDFELGDRLVFDELAFSGGYRWYNYSRTSDRLHDTGEFFAGIETELIAHPYFQLAYDTDEHDGWYYEIGLSEPIPFRDGSERDVVIPWVSMGFSSSLEDDEHPIYDDNGIAFVGVGLKGILAFDESFSLQPEATYDIEVDDATTSDFAFGVNFVGEFPGAREHRR